jgi:glycosyltransferase involved in cell wall biosynthesis
MNNTPKISLIIPTYNCASYLKRCIISALEQTYDNMEIIVVDDGSTDNTKNIVQSFGDSVHYIYQENRGLAGARNTGIKASKGQYLAFLDADDCFDKENIKVKTSYLEEHPQIDWVFSDWDEVDEEGNFLARGSIKWSYAKKQLKDRLFEELIYNRNFISPVTIMIKKAAMEKAGYFDPDVICQEDWDLWLRISLKHPAHYIDKVLVHVLIRPDSLSRNFSKWAQGNALIVDKLNNSLPLDFPNRKRALATLNADKYTYLGRALIQSGKPGKAVIAYLKSIKHLPLQKKIYWRVLVAIIDLLGNRFAGKRG